MNPTELRRKAAGHYDEARKIVDQAKAASRDFTAEERSAYDRAIEAHDKSIEDAIRLEHFEEVGRSLGESNGRTSRSLPHEDASNTRGGQHSYSILKAMRQRLEQVEGRGRLDGIELEVHQELSRRKNPTSPVRGVLIPWSASAESRTTGLVDTTAGAGTIPTVLDSTLIDILRARMVTVGMGMQVLEGMTGLFAIPRQNQSVTGYWVAEGAAPSTSNPTTDQVPFSPKTVGAYTDYTRRFMEQTNQDAERFVRNDLTAVLARALETAVLNGSGASNQPKGILQNSAIGTVAIGANGGAPTWDAIVNLESQIAIANADMGSLGYVTDAAVRGKLKRTAKIGSTFPVYLWGDGATPLNGYRCGVTNLLPANLTKGTGVNLHSMIFGNWADVITALWSGIDILVDPYTGSNTGNVRIVALQDADINVRHSESFTKVVDIDAS